MAYDEALAERVRGEIADDPGVIEKKMFGGVAFMLHGNMAVGVSRDDLMVRVGPDDHEAALSRPGVRDFDMSGRPMRGWILVAGDSVAVDEDLIAWIEVGMSFASSLPPK